MVFTGTVRRVASGTGLGCEVGNATLCGAVSLAKLAGVEIGAVSSPFAETIAAPPGMGGASNGSVSVVCAVPELIRHPMLARAIQILIIVDFIVVTRWIRTTGNFRKFESTVITRNSREYGTSGIFHQNPPF